jgi:3-deoxy-manno-octulosonate cytidylyltransferase (CMP-KDO synthetase)
VETHGKNPQKDVIAIIPARFSSSRLPGKLLLEAGGKPLIVRTLEQVSLASRVSRVLVAVDDEELLRVVRGAGGEAVMTSTDHRSGSDRIAEVAAGLEGDPIIVNVQGDEPLISPAVIDRAVDCIVSDSQADIATTSEEITAPEDVLSPDVVKVVSDISGYAIYFSRSPIPYPREAARNYGSLEKALHDDPAVLRRFRKHTGLYVFRKASLMRFTRLPQARVEGTEMLEQLRAIENGMKIRVVEVSERSIGIDTEEDLVRLRAHFERLGEGLATR